VPVPMQTMRSPCLTVVALMVACPWACAEQTNSNPMGTVLQLLGELTAKITRDGEAAAKAYNEYFEWCDDTSKNTNFAIETATKAKAKLEAKIDELDSDIATAGSKIEELAAAIATGQRELGDAVTIRKKEAADFSASEAELMDTVDTLGRAVAILSKEMAKNPASFAQLDSKTAANSLQALSAVLDAASFLAQDQAKLMAFVQAQQSDESDDLEMGAPAAAVYKSHSSNILDVLEDMKVKAEEQLSNLRKAEVNNRHNFEMLKQSLEDQSAADTKDMEDEKAGKASASEALATAKGDLDVTNKELASSKQQLATAHSSCLQVAADHEASVAARKEELGVIAQATKMLEATSSGAVSQTYSLLQIRSHSDLVGSEVAAAVKRLAKKQRSAALAQLASRIATVLRFGSSGGNPFGKVKGLIQDMIAKLEKEAGDEATEKAYCDEQLAKTEAKKSELEEDVAKMTSRIDKAAARSAQLQAEIKTLEGELSALAKEQAEMDRIRQETHSEYVAAKADLELGLSGVRKAVDALREYYGAGSSMLQDDTKFGAFMQQPAAPETHAKSQGAGESIINILQVCESDFATNLAKEESEEADAQSEYEKITQENSVTKTTKDQSVKYKSQEATSQEKTAAEYSADRETANTELSAVLDYYGKIKDRCIAKPETYAARKARREAEIRGLKEALSILEDETALVQRKRHGSFRGTLSTM